jgi:uncharacterized protein YaeQ
MALTSTVHTLRLSLSDSDRGVYEDLEVRLALHPSESPDFFATRLLAYALEYSPDLEFSKGGISDTSGAPALFVAKPGGGYATWIEVGAPDADRLHRASKGAERVAVYCHRDPRVLLRQLGKERIHRAEEIPIYSFEKHFLEALASRLERRTTLQLSVTGRHLYLELPGVSLESPLEEHRLAGSV